MEEYGQKQSQQGKILEHIIENFKKDGSGRKTTKAYYERRLQQLEEAWGAFEATDNQIRLLKELPLEHPYFAQDYYNAILSIYTQYRDHFRQMADSFENHEEDQGQPAEVSKAAVPQDTEAASSLEQLWTTKVTPLPPLTMTRQDIGLGAVPKKPQMLKPAPTSAMRTATPMPSMTKSSDQSEIMKIMRRQKGIIQSLRRVLDGLHFSDDNPKQYYKLKADTIAQYWSSIEEQNHAIWELTDDPLAMGYELDNYIALEEIIQQILIKLSMKIDDMVTPNVTNSHQQVTPLVKLPKITIPRFDGDYLKWPQFSDLFTQMVHNQPLSNCQKMWYLKANVTGEAEKLIRHLALTEENYTTAWKVLHERYNNTRILVATLINKIMGQPSHASETASATTIKSMHDTTHECLLALENIGVSTENWDPMLLHILLKKLDKTTHTLYEQSLADPKALQTIKGFLIFLETRFQSLEALGAKKSTVDDHPRKSNVRFLSSGAVTTSDCTVCKGNHQLFQCGSFLKLNPSNRLQLLRKHGICVNCLKTGHKAAQCKLRGCTKCAKKHNTLVHLARTEEPTTSRTSMTPIIREPTTTVNSDTVHTKANNITPSESTIAGTALSYKCQRGYVLLSTARVRLTACNGTSLECRAILDSGSQINVISQRLVRKLGLQPIADAVSIEGIGKGKQQTHQRVNVLLQSRVNNYSARVEAFVLQNIISPQPARMLDITTWAIPRNIQLADPNFNLPENIDLLLGAEFYHQLLAIGQIKLRDDLPTMQNTVLGWIISGKIEGLPASTSTCGIFTENEALDNAIERFWRVEEVEETITQMTPAQARCENYFNQTMRRDNTGRFTVSLPFADNAAKLGESRTIALRRFASLERKLARQDELRKQYVDFMEEYIQLGHMKEVNPETLTSPCYYLPHHGVCKPDSRTTKLRVVFDASAKTSSNISLNDLLHTGPTIQEELFTILLRFRMPRFVFTADIEKMYRQILIKEEDQKYQLVLWRSDPSQPIRCYQLCTVTYGTTAAPYLATKCLQVLAQNGAQKYPLGSSSILQNCYVDDVMTGHNSLSEAIQTQSQLNSLLMEAGFKLRKWCSNHPRLLKNILPENQAVQLDFTQDKEEQIKTLGLIWLPKSDQFSVKTNGTELHRVTKRSVASHIARLFDPLGIVSPVIVTAKIFLQNLWQLKLDWDAALPMELHTKWVQFHEDLKNMDEIQFPRHLFANEVPKTIQLHVFTDASEKAYGAAVYTRSINSNGIVVIRLLCAKSRVAPVKKITLPRLELCAAKLGAELASRVKEDLNCKDTLTYFWTDSQIVLAWINSQSASFHVFVANRIAAIQRLTDSKQWRHVVSEDNPADVLSRGTTPQKLKTHNLWFYGPPFLHGAESLWPSAYLRDLQVSCDPERKRTALTTNESPTGIQDSVNPLHYIQHGNSFRRLQRITAYALRFVHRTRRRTTSTLGGTVLSTRELDSALYVLIRVMQEANFEDEIGQLQKFKEVSKTSPLSSLAPFLDENGIIRVGGRLEASSLAYDAKHPMLLPYAHQWTKLLLTDLHIENRHCGPQTLLASTRQRFWPIKGKTLARSVVQHCVRCTRAKPKLLSQMMGNLPAHRIQPARPFINSGVDFCGPLFVHYQVRGKQPRKAYVAVFCCFATKAVHLELVGDLTTDAFIAALKRFIGRRGHCKNLYCDNATNFVGAYNQLNRLNDAIYAEDAKTKITSTCSSSGIDFHFIPPRAPHFGGLWEAAVKSAKHLLLRSVASASLTYEELQTVMVGIEAILNSRPLTAMSSDPNDLTALTPGHFLVGEPLTAPVDSFAQPCKVGLLKRWKLVSHIKQEFWRRWSHEYLNELQHRNKWKQRCQNIEPGTIVIIKEDNTPAMKWPLGRIIQTFKGNDGCIRVVDVRTATNVVRRPVHKLAPLPIETAPPPELDDPSTSTTQAQTAPLTALDGPSTSTAHTQYKHNTSTGRSRDNNNHSPRKKARTSFGSLVVSTLLVCLCLPTIRGSPVEVTRFSNRPGIHFERLGTTRIVSTEWNLVVYYNLQPYWREFTIFEKGIGSLDHLCEQIKHKSTCKSVTEQFQHLRHELSIDNELLSMRAPLNRTKRGAFNIVGNIANSLFGVLDSKYAEDMANTIEAVKGNENHLQSLIKNQTSILDSTINIIKRNQVDNDKKFQALEGQLAQLVNRLNDMNEDQFQLKLTQLFSSLSIQLSLMATTLQRIASSISDALTNSQHGQIGPQLLSPSQLMQEIFLIQNHLPTNLRLPTDQGNILQLYKLIKVKSRAVNNYVIFKLIIPLVNLEQYDLFRLIPIPLYINNSVVEIHSCSPYLAITLHRDQHYPLTEQELATCTMTAGNAYLCPQHHPVYYRRAHVCSCEIDFFNGISNPKSCNLHRTTNHAGFIQLSHANQWIYALKDETPINVACVNETTSILLSGSGILKIQPHCAIKHDTATLQGHQIYSSEGRLTYTRFSNLLNITTPERLASILQENAYTHSQLEELQELQRMLKMQNLDLPNVIHSQSTHSLTIGYIGLLLAGSVVIWALFRMREDICRHLRKKPKPRPRTHHGQNDFVVNIESHEG